jgi:hypothetical protein
MLSELLVTTKGVARPEGYLPRPAPAMGLARQKPVPRPMLRWLTADAHDTLEPGVSDTDRYLRSTRANDRSARGPLAQVHVCPKPFRRPSHTVSAHMVSGDGPATGVAAAMISSMRAITT